MTPSKHLMRPPVKTHGGKYYLSRRIVGVFPEHRVYIEPYLGGGSVMINKPPSEVEIASDLNAPLIALWQTIASNSWAFRQAIKATPYCFESFLAAGEASRSPVEADRVLAFLVKNRMSRGGLAQTFAWSERLREGLPGDLNAWRSFVEEALPRITDRVKDVRFSCADAIQVIADHDNPGTLLYLDPPYIPSTRTAPKVYAHEMTEDQHGVMLAALMRMQRATWFLSGYANYLYNLTAQLQGWHSLSIEVANHSGQSAVKQRRVEVVWSNRPFPGSTPSHGSEQDAPMGYRPSLESPCPDGEHDDLAQTIPRVDPGDPEAGPIQQQQAPARGRAGVPPHGARPPGLPRPGEEDTRGEGAGMNEDGEHPLGWSFDRFDDPGLARSLWGRPDSKGADR